MLCLLTAVQCSDLAVIDFLDVGCFCVSSLQWRLRWCVCEHAELRQSNCASRFFPSLLHRRRFWCFVYSYFLHIGSNCRFLLAFCMTPLTKTALFASPLVLPVCQSPQPFATLCCSLFCSLSIMCILGTCKAFLPSKYHNRTKQRSAPLCAQSILLLPRSDFCLSAPNAC